MPSILANSSSRFLEKVMVFPVLGITFKSGSNSLAKARLNSRSPENPDRTINKEKAPAKTPIAAIMVIILIALLLLLENR